MSKEYDGNTIAQIVRTEDMMAYLQNGYSFGIVVHEPSEDESDEDFEDEEFANHGRWHDLRYSIDWGGGDGKETFSDFIDSCYGKPLDKVYCVVWFEGDMAEWGSTVESAVDNMNDLLKSSEYTLDEFGEPEVEE